MDTTQTPNNMPQINMNNTSNSSSVAVIVVILIIALGGAYFWYSRAQKTVVAPKKQATTVQNSNVPNEVLRNDLQASGDLNIDADMNGLDTVYGN
jgi:uncharacterized protein HemX